MSFRFLRAISGFFGRIADFLNLKALFSKSGKKDGGKGKSAGIEADEPDEAPPAPEPYRSLNTYTFPETGSASGLKLGSVFRKPPHPDLYELQLKCASIIVNTFESECLPADLCAYLKHFDAFQAVERFLSDLGFSYKALIADKGLRNLYNYVLGVLIEAGSIRGATNLDLKSLYRKIREAVSERRAQAGREMEEVLERLHRVRDIADAALKLGSKSVFKSYHAEFHDPIIPAFRRNWAEYPDEDVRRLEEALKYWKVLHNEYDSLIYPVRTSMNYIKKNLDSGVVSREVYDYLGKRIHRIIIRSRNGVITPLACLKELKAELEKLRIVVGEIRAKTGDGGENPGFGMRRDKERVEVEKAMHTLGFGGYAPEDLNRDVLAELKKRYREMAMRHHTDLVGGSGRKIRDINAAYTLIRKYVSGRV